MILECLLNKTIYPFSYCITHLVNRSQISGLQTDFYRKTHKLYLLTAVEAAGNQKPEHF